MNKRSIYKVIIALFVLLFLYTGAIKLIDHEQFLREIKQSPIVGKLNPKMGFIVPIAELLIAMMLITKRWTIYGLYLTLILMTVFTIYLIYLNQIQPIIPCSCGGYLQRLPFQVHITFNILLIIIAIIAIRINITSRVGVIGMVTNKRESNH